jgi:hypothetical protein
MPYYSKYCNTAILCYCIGRQRGVTAEAGQAGPQAVTMAQLPAVMHRGLAMPE